MRLDELLRAYWFSKHNFIFRCYCAVTACVEVLTNESVIAGDLIPATKSYACTAVRANVTEFGILLIEHKESYQHQITNSRTDYAIFFS